MNGHADPVAERATAWAEAIVAAHAFWEQQLSEVNEWVCTRPSPEALTPKMELPSGVELSTPFAVVKLQLFIRRI